MTLTSLHEVDDHLWRQLWVLSSNAKIAYGLIKMIATFMRLALVVDMAVVSNKVSSGYSSADVWLPS